jgi:sigma-B regulation protein RsbU (phosphoserine phosphatase)
MGSTSLAQASVVKHLSESEVERLAAVTRVLELEPHRDLFCEGDRGDRFYIILEGELEVYQAVAGQGERVLGVRGPGEYIGEMSLLNPDGLRTASIRSRGHVRLWEMTHTQFGDLIGLHPSLALEIARELSARMTGDMHLTMRNLEEKNRQLTLAYEELKAAQAQLVEKERLEHELQVAHNIQMSSLPKALPQIPGFDFGACIVPARAVGGDFYDLLVLDEHRVVVVIGDVTDKGVPAALFTAQIHALLHAGVDLVATPGEVLRRVNKQLLDMEGPGLFATVLYGVLDGRVGEFSYARAGHEPPYLCVPAGGVHQLSWNLGQPLGLFRDVVLDEQSVVIPPGGTLVLYTDGLTDGRNRAGEAFGDQGLAEHLVRLAGLPAQTVCDGLWQNLVAFQDGDPQDDDVAMVAIHSEGDGR